MNYRFKNNRFLNALFLFLLSIILYLNYMYGFFLPNEQGFFNIIQEALVVGSVLAQKNDVIDPPSYGLGIYSYVVEYLPDSDTYPSHMSVNIGNTEGYTNGYANDGKSIVVTLNDYTGRVTWRGKKVLFSNGQELDIVSTSHDNNYVYIFFDPELFLNENDYGSIENIQFIDLDNNLFRKGTFANYKSQVGLNGYILRRVLYHFDYDTIVFLMRLLPSALTSIIVILIIIQLFKRYGFLFSLVWYIVFAFSPWVAKFAHDAYWLEFLWFFTILIGLIYTNYNSHKTIRIICYITFLLTIFIKASCGYEYISSIMLAGLIFPTEYCYSNIKAPSLKPNILKNILNIVNIGFSMLLGFLFAFVWHSYLRGEGNLYQGAINILNEDVLRSTLSSWSAEYSEAYISSMNASILDTLKLYFFNSDAFMFNISGNVFIYLFIASIISVIFLTVKKMYDKRYIVITLMSFLAPLSWFLLAKSHSNMHSFLNYVLWYLGFMQMCFYNVILMCRYLVLHLKKSTTLPLPNQ